MRQNLNNKGFTLLELMIGLIVFMLIGTGLTVVFVSGLRFFTDQQSQVGNQFSVTEISTMLERDIRQSTSASKTTNCLNLTLFNSNIVQYCLNTSTQVMTRNSNVIANGIESFSVIVNTNQIKITLTTDPDLRLMKNTLEFEYYLREGNY
jgi:Tfp pilus assembly protein PilW